MDEAVDSLRAAADPSRLPGMARVGIRVDDALGVSIPSIRAIAKRAGTDQRLAEALWRTGIHEARILATHVADFRRISDRVMERWARDVDSWDLGDAAADLFAATPARDGKVREWAGRTEPFVKRCAFAMIARAAVSDEQAPDDAFVAWFPLIEEGAQDDRNEVKKGVSWALRQIGKRNPWLYRAAIAEGEQILEAATMSGSRGARWVARDVLRELRHPDHVARLAR
ncbi:MAG: DNA alkylation repair protein [Actinomycetota bacterium]